MVDFKVTNHLGLPAFGPTGGLSHTTHLGARVQRQEQKSESEETDTQTNNEIQCKVTSHMLELSKHRWNRTVEEK